MERNVENVVLVIPALDPDARLVELVCALWGRWTGGIVVVDDGSAPGCADVFGRCAELGCEVVRHPANCGKGTALKTGIARAAELWPGAAGIVTCDCDGRHLPHDVLAVGRAVEAEPDALHVATRDFRGKTVPGSTHVFNTFTRLAIRFFCGVDVRDTQSGMRGMPMAFARSLVDEPAGGFEFECALLCDAREAKLDFREVPVGYVLDPNSPETHFDPLRDTARILGVMVELFVKCTLTSVGCYALDIVLFALLMRVFAGWGGGEAAAGAATVAATVAARVVSAGANFAVNRRRVFGADSSAVRVARYAALAVGVMCASAAGTTVLTGVLGTPAVPTKVVVDLALFFVNYKLQHAWVFA